MSFVRSHGIFPRFIQLRNTPASLFNLFCLFVLPPGLVLCFYIKNSYIYKRVCFFYIHLWWEAQNTRYVSLFFLTVMNCQRKDLCSGLKIFISFLSVFQASHFYETQCHIFIFFLWSFSLLILNMLM